MTFALSTNALSGRLAAGEAIAERARALGFEALELGFALQPEQAEGIRRRLDLIPVESVHAFCPVPISAPCGHPELYQLANLDAEARAMALFQVRKNLTFAADFGAKTLVLHAGRVPCASRFARLRARRRRLRGSKLLEAFRLALEALADDLERLDMTLALENLPYCEGFPNESELAAILSWKLGPRIRGWLDLGHDHVRVKKGWRAENAFAELETAAEGEPFAGMHIHDSRGGDDHLLPGEGEIDFSAFAARAARVRHRVFEPSGDFTDAALAAALANLKTLWRAK